MRPFSAFVVVACLLCAPPMIESSLAQDDWTVRRDPFDRKVIARYKRILKRNPADQSALRKLLRLYKRHRSVDLLVREYKRALDRTPGDFSTAVVLGHLHMNRGDRDRALHYYERASSLRPNSPAVQLALGDLYRSSGKPAQAGSAYRLVLAGRPGKKLKKQALRALIELALSDGTIDAVATYYEQFIALDPKNFQAYVELGDALAQHGRHEAAISVFKRAAVRLKADPARQVEVITRIGAAYEAAGNEEEAIRVYRQATAKVGKSYYLRKELLSRIIDIYRRRQALNELVAYCENAWPQRRRGHLEWDVLARLYEETGSQENAINAYRKATAKAPYELDTQRRLIALLENSGREDDAVKQYEIVIRVAPGEPRFQLELAERYWRRGKDRKALALLAKMERRFPSDAGVHAAIAGLYTRWGKTDLALKAHVRLTRIEPSDISHLVNLGEQWFQRNEKNKAVAVWKKILSQKTATNYARLGEVYAEHDMLGEALAMYRNAIKLEANNPDHYKGRASVHERRRNYDLAVADWERVLALTPKTDANKPTRREARRRGVNLLKRARGNRLYRRIRSWQLAFRATPADVEAGYFLVEAHLRERRYSKARRVLERLLAIDANDLEAMQQLVKVYKREHQYDQAVALLKRLAELAPARRREYYTEIAEIKTDQRRDEEAIEWISKAVASSPNDPIAHQRLAERYVEMQEFDKAIAAYEKAIELDKRNFRVYFALARLYVDVPQRASALYRDVLRRATDDEILRKAGDEAIALEKMLGSLGGLERVLAPLAFTFNHKPIYRRILVQLYNDYVPELVRSWRRGDAQTRKAARVELDRVGAHGLKPLLEALSDEKDPTQQRIAVDVLGYLGNKGAAAPLVRLAKKPSATPETRRRGIGTLIPVLDWEVRVDALIAAGRLGDPRTIDSLVDLSRHSDKTMREAAIFALGRTGHRDAVAALIAALADSSASVQTLGCMGLAQVAGLRGNRQAIAAVIALVANRKHSDIARAACAFTLGYIGEPGAAAVLLETLSRGNDEAQRLAAWSLGRLGQRRATSVLLGAYFSRHERVREMVGWALDHTVAGKPASRPAIDFSRYPRKRSKYDAMAAVKNLPGQLDAAWPAPTIVIGHEAELARGLRSALARHRDMVLRVLENLDGHADHLSLGPLTADLSRLSATRKKRLLQALDQIAREISPQLARLVDHRDSKVRALTLSVLAKIDVSDTVTTLLRSIDEQRGLVRLAAMRAAANHVRLYGKHGPELARAVANQLHSDRWQARLEAAEILGRFGKYAPEAALIEATRDPYAYVREGAVVALGRLQRQSAVEALIAASTDTDRAVQLAAIRSLGAIGGHKAVNQLRHLARSGGDPGLVKAARELLRRTKN